MTGLEMLDTLRSKGFRQRAVILTGYSEFDDAKQAIKMNVCDYLEKPVSDRELKETLARVQEELLLQKLPAKTHDQIEAFLKAVEDCGEDQKSVFLGKYMEKSGFLAGASLQLAHFCFDRPGGSTGSMLRSKLRGLWDQASVNHVILESRNGNRWLC